MHSLKYKDMADLTDSFLQVPTEPLTCKLNVKPKVVVDPKRTKDPEVFPHFRGEQ